MTKVKIQQTIRAFFNKIDRFFERAIDKKRLTIKEFIIGRIIKDNPSLYRDKNFINDDDNYPTIQDIKDIAKGKTGYLFTTDNYIFTMSCDTISMIHIDDINLKLLDRHDNIDDYIDDYGIAICSLDD